MAPLGEKGLYRDSVNASYIHLSSVNGWLIVRLINMGRESHKAVMKATSAIPTGREREMLMMMTNLIDRVSVTHTHKIHPEFQWILIILDHELDWTLSRFSQTLLRASLLLSFF